MYTSINSSNPFLHSHKHFSQCFDVYGLIVSDKGFFFFFSRLTSIEHIYETLSLYIYIYIYIYIINIYIIYIYNIFNILLYYYNYKLIYITNY